jgi:hypothetical protein
MCKSGTKTRLLNPVLIISSPIHALTDRGVLGFTLRLMREYWTFSAVYYWILFLPNPAQSTPLQIGESLDSRSGSWGSAPFLLSTTDYSISLNIRRAFTGSMCHIFIWCLVTCFILTVGTFCCGLETSNWRAEAGSKEETYTVHGFMVMCILFIVPHNVYCLSRRN